jgi:hypothetical protein
MSEIDLEKARREVMRWRILCALNAGRPLPMSEDLVLQVLQDAALEVTHHGLRRELDYLENRKLIEISSRHTPCWMAELTHLGVDVVEYTVDCNAGIARPRKWF